ncbi:hypothetical protein AB0N87_28330 [Streptomyces sp. NPDC093228]|uniref:hypothetical protein n=1 Tax=Streptomyces sp. NPDC093228 TaxID=3155070 RepID=UPI00342F4654
MDPAVIAAIVTTPTTLIAAAGAYAAGRHQARGAHRGPVDAVRRQHQRDAYATLLSALNTYAHATDWNQCLQRARLEMTEAEGGFISIHHPPDWAENHARHARVAAAPLLEPVRPALDVVSLEGPKHVADLAEMACLTAYSVKSAAVIVTVMEARRRSVSSDDPDQLHAMLRRYIAAFTEAARDYLNG